MALLCSADQQITSLRTNYICRKKNRLKRGEKCHFSHMYFVEHIHVMYMYLYNTYDI